MELAPLGEGTYLDETHRVLAVESDSTFRLDLSYFRHHNEDLRYSWEDGPPTVEPHFGAAVENLLDSARRPDEPLERRDRSGPRGLA